jgi:hypothetical protein
MIPSEARRARVPQDAVARIAGEKASESAAGHFAAIGRPLQAWEVVSLSCPSNVGRPRGGRGYDARCGHGWPAVKPPSTLNVWPVT